MVGEIVDVPEDDVPVPSTAGHTLHTTRSSSRHHPHLTDLENQFNSFQLTYIGSGRNMLVTGICKKIWKERVKLA